MVGITVDEYVKRVKKISPIRKILCRMGIHKMYGLVDGKR
jgi:hypothetical protein